MLPRRQSMGEAIGSGLGSGFSSGMQALAKMKLDQMISGPANIASLRMAGAAAGLPQEEINRYIGESGYGGGFGGGVSGAGRGGIRPQEIIKIGLKKQEIDIKKQSSIDKRLAPGFDQLRTKTSIAERVLPNLNRLAELTKEGKVGGGLLGAGWFQGKEGQEYQSIVDELEGMKIKGLPLASHNFTTKQNRINQLISKYKKDLRYKETVDDLLKDHDNNAPANIFKLADDRMKNQGQQGNQKASMNQPQSNASSGIPPQFEEQGQVDPQGQFEEQGQVDPQAEGMVPNYSPEQLESMLPSGTQREISQTPMGLDHLLGLLGRTAASAGAGYAGGPGQLTSIAPNLVSAASSGGTPSYEELREKAPYALPPTTKRVKEIIESATEPDILSPQSGVERWLLPAAEEFGELMSGGAILKPIIKGAQLIGKVPKFLQSAQNFLKVAPKAAAAITTAGNAAKVALEEAGAPESVQDLGKLATSLGASMGSVYMASRGAAKAEKAIEKGISSFPPGIRAIWNSFKRFGKELADPKISSVSREDINGIYGNLGSHLSFTFKGTPLAGVFNDYIDLLKGGEVSSRIHNFLRKNLLSIRGQVGLNSILRMAGTSKAAILGKFGGAIVAAGGVLGQLEKGFKLMNLNPTFRRKYGDIFRTGILAAVNMGNKKLSEKEGRD